MDSIIVAIIVTILENKKKEVSAYKKSRIIQFEPNHTSIIVYE